MTDTVRKIDDAVWENLRQQLNKRRRMRQLRKMLLPLSVVALAVLCLIGGVTAYYVVTHPTQPLVLPESVSTRLSLVAADQTPVKPEDFVTGLDDTGIQVAFGDEYDPEQIGQQKFSLVFTKGYRMCEVEVQLYRFHLEPSVKVALGEEKQLTIRDFVPDERIEASFVTEPEEGKCGIFELQVQCQGQEYTVKFTVTEDIPPKATGKELTVEAGTIPKAADFVSEIKDHTEVTVTYKETQEFIMAGQCPVILVLTDLFGNTAEVEAVANVVPATNGPQFSGLDTIYLELGAAVSYKSGVSVTDAQDGSLTFTVDPGDFDSKVSGRYTVLYTAVDSDGNKLIVPRTIVVESHIGQIVRENAQAVLDEIIKPGMTRDEKIYAVFKRVWHFVWYSGSSDKSSVENAAYEGFTKWAGDCYTYYAMVRVMLDMLDIPNVEVKRVGGTSNHWWNLVQFSDGKYYHVDATPHRYTNMEHFKMTQSVIEAYTNKPEVAGYRPNYYVYDQTLPQYQNIEIAQ